MRRTYRILPALVFAWLWLCVPAHAAYTVQPGDKAPFFTVTQLDGRVFDMAAQRGRVVVVHFWATWCAPCQQEMPILNTVYRRFRPEGLVMIGVSMDRPRRRADIFEIMKQYDYPMGLISDAPRSGFGRINVLPVTYVISKDGIIQAKFTPEENPVTEANLARILKPLLSQ